MRGQSGYKPRPRFKLQLNSFATRHNRSLILEAPPAPLYGPDAYAMPGGTLPATPCQLHLAIRCNLPWGEWRVPVPVLTYQFRKLQLGNCQRIRAIPYRINSSIALSLNNLCPAAKPPSGRHVPFDRFLTRSVFTWQSRHSDPYRRRSASG